MHFIKEKRKEKKNKNKEASHARLGILTTRMK
jgi:hypothetical protein